MHLQRHGVTSSSRMGGIGSEYFHEQAATLHFLGRLFDSLLVDVPLEIDKENILPGFPAGGTGFNLGHVQAMGGKGPQKIVQGANFVFDR